MLKSLFVSSILFLCYSQVTLAQGNAFMPVKLATTVVLKTPVGAAAQANGVKSGPLTVGVDTSIRVNPTMAYISIDVPNLTGSTQMDVLNGVHLFWVYDKAGKQIVLPAKVLYSVKASMGENTVNLSVRVPYRFKNDKNAYTVHYRWESKDKGRNIDLLTTK